jgi:hypothetical protein
MTAGSGIACPENGIREQKTKRNKKKISEYRPEDLRVAWSDLHFNCDWLHHVKHLPNRYCAFVYQLAKKLSHESGVFDASAINIAHDLGCDEKSIRRAIEYLRNTGWFVQIKRSRSHGEYRPNAYNVRDHAEWAEAHPGLCGERIDDKLPWAGEGDRIAQFLYHQTGGAVKWREFETRKMRSFGHLDAVLQKLFRLYWDDKGWSVAPERVPGEFNRFLADLSKQSSVPAASKEITSSKQSAQVPDEAANPLVAEPDAFVQQLVATSNAKLSFDSARSKQLRKHRNVFGDENVQQALQQWLRENDLRDRSSNQATLDFISDLPRLVAIIKQKAKSRAAADMFTSADGLSSPTTWTQ